MLVNPWTGPDPRPGDFADVTDVDPRYVEAQSANPDANLTIVVGIEDKDAGRVQQLAAERPGEVICRCCAAPDRS